MSDNSNDPKNWFEWKNYILKFLDNQSNTNEDIKKILKDLELNLNTNDNKNENFREELNNIRNEIYQVVNNIKELEQNNNNNDNSNKNVNKEIEQLKRTVVNHDTIVKKIVTDIELLKLKSGAWGAASASFIMLLLYLKDLMF